MAQPSLVGEIPAFTYTGVYTIQRQTAVVAVGVVGLTLLVVGIVASLGSLSLPSGGGSFLVASGAIIIVADMIALVALYFKNRIASLVLDGRLKKLQAKKGEVFSKKLESLREMAFEKKVEFARQRYFICHEFQETTEILFSNPIEGSRFFSFFFHSNQHHVDMGFSARLVNTVYVVQAILNGSVSLHFFLRVGERDDYRTELLDQCYSEVEPENELSAATGCEDFFSKKEIHSEEEGGFGSDLSDAEEAGTSLDPRQAGNSDHEEN